MAIAAPANPLDGAGNHACRGLSAAARGPTSPHADFGALGVVSGFALRSRRSQGSRPQPWPCLWLFSLWVMLATMLFSSEIAAQDFNYRGFAEARTVVYPQTTPRDDDRVAVEGRVRFEPAYGPLPWLTLSGSVEARLDNLEQVEPKLDWGDRGVQRPAFSVRQASATLRRGRLTGDVGKQFIRWGKADILNPTDRFAPRDFLEVTDNDFLAVTGARIQYESARHSLDGVFVPIFTPSRIPLLNRRWAPLPENVGILSVTEGPPALPKGSQFGARWNYLGSGYEMSFSYFDGFNHLPEIEAQVRLFPPSLILRRVYAPLRMGGADAAVSLPWLTIKGEAAYLTTSSESADDVVLYVVQVERQSGELSVVAGYADEIEVASRSTLDFSPERGLTKSFLGRASYTIDANRSVAVEAALRRNGDGVWIKTEYSQAYGAHWRATLNGTVIAGRARDFLGQYRRNSHLSLTARRSF